MFQNSLAISKKNHKNRYSNDKDNLEIRRVAINKGRPADPGKGCVCEIRTFNCYSSVILLFYPDSGVGGGSRNPGFSRTSFVNGPIVGYVGTSM